MICDTQFKQQTFPGKEIGVNQLLSQNMFDVMVRKRKRSVTTLEVKQHILHSNYLERDVIIDLYIPNEIPAEPSLLLLNDGQDLEKMPFADILDSLFSEKAIEPIICVGIHCGAERKLEYGTAFSADYNGRGRKAGLYNKFIFDEFLPWLRKTLPVNSFKEKSFAGFSLGGLSALDIVWNHASEFKTIGIFSGSLWWRRKAYEDGYDETKDRLMHLQMKTGQAPVWLKFFIECGTLDETSDRNKNGVIDSIDDAMDMITILKEKGFPNESVFYHEIKDGKHDVATWAKALPVFLKWGWGVNEN
jgi:enterochelin esterase-like enzyme